MCTLGGISWWTEAYMNHMVPPPACLNWQDTVEALDTLRAGVQARRKLRPTNGANGSINDEFLATAGKANGASGSGDFNDLSALRVGPQA